MCLSIFCVCVSVHAHMCTCVHVHTHMMYYSSGTQKTLVDPDWFFPSTVWAQDWGQLVRLGDKYLCLLSHLAGHHLAFLKQNLSISPSPLFPSRLDWLTSEPWICLSMSSLCWDRKHEAKTPSSSLFPYVGAGAWTQVFTLVQPALFLMSPLNSPSCNDFKCLHTSLHRQMLVQTSQFPILYT